MCPSLMRGENTEGDTRRAVGTLPNQFLETPLQINWGKKLDESFIKWKHSPE
jgi:hypothetical protein